MITQLMPTECVIAHTSEGGTTDEFGNDVADETLTATRCAVQQSSRSEEEDGSPARGRWDGFFPAETILRSGDSIEVSGHGKFEVIGDPWLVDNLRTGITSHLEATLDLTRGSYEPS